MMSPELIHAVYYFHEDDPKELRRLSDVCAATLAMERGWRVSKRAFDAAQLSTGSFLKEPEPHLLRWQGGGVVDHAEWFSCNRRPAAILSHTYKSIGKIEALAREYGLRFEVLPVSWYWPGRATAVLFMPQ